MIGGHIVLQFIHGADRDTPDGGPDQSGGDIKGGVDLEPGASKIKVLQQGVTQMTGANNDQAVTFVDAEDMTDLRAQFLHVVAIALLTEFAKAA